MSAEDTIGVTRDDGVVTIRIDRPEKKNALTYGMFRRLGDIFDEVAREPGDRAVVLTGVAGSFSSGADLTDTGGATMTGFSTLSGAQWMREVNWAQVALHRCPKPTIAAVNGVAAGAGMNIALGCDIVLASESARFTEIFVRRGLTVDLGGTWLLPRLVGLQRAKDLAFRGEIISAAEALELGLVLRVVADDEIDAEAQQYAARLASLPPVPLMLMKQGLNQSLGWTMDQALEYEAQAQAACFQTEDLAEAMMAFMQKREGVYKGR
ncbi:MAG: enoyl-CoA hydratase/isomerase family protein [Acidimicrobiia bacterium]|nr:enoyl-CoA hydratase/isomerase family protein [Acidimicrobiia bacterium]